MRGRAQGEVEPCLGSAREFSGPHWVGRGEVLPSARKGSEADASPCPSSEAGRDWMDAFCTQPPPEPSLRSPTARRWQFEPRAAPGAQERHLPA